MSRSKRSTAVGLAVALAGTLGAVTPAAQAAECRNGRAAYGTVRLALTGSGSTAAYATMRVQPTGYVCGDRLTVTGYNISKGTVSPAGQLQCGQVESIGMNPTGLAGVNDGARVLPCRVSWAGRWFDLPNRTYGPWQGDRCVEASVLVVLRKRVDRTAQTTRSCLS